jgi:hypothetical protein
MTLWHKTDRRSQLQRTRPRSHHRQEHERIRKAFPLGQASSRDRARPSQRVSEQRVAITSLRTRPTNWEGSSHRKLPCGARTVLIIGPNESRLVEGTPDLALQPDVIERIENGSAILNLDLRFSYYGIAGKCWGLELPRSKRLRPSIKLTSILPGCSRRRYSLSDAQEEGSPGIVTERLFLLRCPLPPSTPALHGRELASPVLTTLGGAPDQNGNRGRTDLSERSATDAPCPRGWPPPFGPTDTVRRLGAAMDKRTMTELAELLEEIDALIHDDLKAATVERETTLEADINAAKGQLLKVAVRLYN